MGELYNPYPKLPKNIRQVGERDPIVKLYMEDYVNTYLHRLRPSGIKRLRVGLLLGESRSHEGEPCLFVDGALEMEEAAGTDEQVVFTEGIWKAAYQEMEQQFPKRSILGWFICGMADRPMSPLNYWKQHGEYFSEKYQLMYLGCGLDGDEEVYVAAEESFYRLRGYCVYYERNQMMQDYMVSRRDARRVESGMRDTVIQDFRQKLDARQEEALRQHSTVRTLKTACAALGVLVLACGVTMFNNYQKMRQMESVIASAILAENRFGWPSFETAEAVEEELEVEELPGEVYPTRAELVIEAETENISESMAANEVSAAAAQAGVTGRSGEEIGMRADSEAVETEPEAEPVQIPADAVVYVVQEGETLYGICMEQYQGLANLQKICLWNELTDENRISAGQKLYLPSE